MRICFFFDQVRHSKIGMGRFFLFSLTFLFSTHAEECCETIEIGGYAQINDRGAGVYVKSASTVNGKPSYTISDGAKPAGSTIYWEPSGRGFYNVFIIPIINSQAVG